MSMRGPRALLVIIWLLVACTIERRPAARAGAPCGHVGTLLGFVALDAHTIAGATDAGNLARSTDGGHCWVQAAVDQHGPRRMGEFLRDPRHGQVLLAGSGNLARVGFPIGYGLLRSADGGATWQALGARNGLPTTPFSVASLAATTAGLFAALICRDELTALQQGRPVVVQCAWPVFRSRDDGRTWRPVGPGAVPVAGGPIPFESGVQVLASRPGATLVAAAAPLVGDAGLYRSSDDGTHWALMAREDRLRGATALLPLPGSAPVVLAGVGLSTLSAQILRSQDGGRTWGVALAADAMRDPLVLGFVADGSRVLCAGLQHLYISVDAGRTWSPLAVSGLPGGAAGQPPSNLWLGRVPDGSLLLSVQGGVFRSTDGGYHWRRL